MLDPATLSTLSSNVLAWTDGWALSRRASEPQPIRGGVYIRVDSATESGRYVLTAPDPDRACELAVGVTESDFWIKWPGSAEAAPSLGEGWTAGQRLHLMRTSLAASPMPVPPPGYRLDLIDEGNAVEARVVTDSGALAARGRVGLGGVAVPDQIVTQPEHQRRGLASVVMTALSNVAVDAGRTEGILLASTQGRSLYEVLGWRIVTEFCEAVFRAEQSG